jgi:hypothetical protein
MTAREELLALPVAEKLDLIELQSGRLQVSND